MTAATATPTRAVTLIDLAQVVARDAHEHQVDKSGRPYISHPERVAVQVRELYPNATERTVAAAWLHDVLEDSSFTPDDLILYGIPSDVVDTVKLLTRRTHEHPNCYYRRIRAHASALQVKHADICDNLNPGRLAMLDPETRSRLVSKYTHALIVLGLPLDPHREAIR